MPLEGTIEKFSLLQRCFIGTSMLLVPAVMFTGVLPAIMVLVPSPKAAAPIIDVDFAFRFSMVLIPEKYEALPVLAMAYTVQPAATRVVTVAVVLVVVERPYTYLLPISCSLLSNINIITLLTVFSLSDRARVTASSASLNVKRRVAVASCPAVSSVSPSEVHDDTM